MRPTALTKGDDPLSMMATERKAASTGPSGAPPTGNFNTAPGTNVAVKPLRVPPIGSNASPAPLRPLYSSQNYAPSAHAGVPALSPSATHGITPIHKRVSVLAPAPEFGTAASSSAVREDGVLDIRAAERALDHRRAAATAATPVVGGDNAEGEDSTPNVGSALSSPQMQYPPLLQQQQPPFALYPVPPEATAYFADDSEGPVAVVGEQRVLHLHRVHHVVPATGRETLGELIATTYQLVFVPYREQPPPVAGLPHMRPMGRTAWIPLNCIEAWVVDKRSVRPVTRAGEAAVCVDIFGKDARHLRIGFQHPNDAQAATNAMMCYMYPAQPKFLFPLCLRSPPPPLPPHLDGWKLFDPIEEFGRMGLPDADFAVGPFNADYALCDTYPEILCLPAEPRMTPADLAACAKFRSRKRLPALVWKNPRGHQTIWRCSQPCIGIASSRSAEDERVFELITSSNKWSKYTAIFDARPRMNAMGNQLAGKGVESEGKYTTCKVRFMDIHNIHAVRDSYKKLWRAVHTAKTDLQLFTEIGQSGWLTHISTILAAVHQMVACIDRDRASVVTHCSDGWDRTSQLTALTKLCVDPFYRTTRGFIILIEQEWLSFGHKFHERLGHGVKELHDQRSPVFIQFLDCVYQLIRQFPRHFEFTSEFLAQLAIHSYSCRFGTFLFNCEAERRKHNIAERSPSVWSFLLASGQAVAGHLTNAMYSPCGRGDPSDVNEAWPLPLPYGSCRAAAMPIMHPEEVAAAEAAAAAAAHAEVATSPAPAADDGAASPSAAAAAGDDTVSVLSLSLKPSDSSLDEPPLVAPEEDVKEVAGPDAAAEDADDDQHLVSVTGPNGAEGVMTPPPGSAVNTPPHASPATAPEPAPAASVPAPIPAASAAALTSPTPQQELFPRLYGDAYEHPLGRGTVLYPLAAPKALAVWPEYWLRFQKDDAAGMGTGPGAVFPGGGATGTSLVDPRNRLANAHLHWARSVAAEAKAEVIGAQQELVRLAEANKEKDAEIERLRQALAQFTSK